MLSLKKIQKKLSSIDSSIICREWRNSIVLEGEVGSYEAYMEAGYVAANSAYKGVVNSIKVLNQVEERISKPTLRDSYLHGKEVDVLVIGGGVIGCAILRALSKYDISLMLLEKEEDLAMHQSSRNDGMIHPGLNPTPGSNKAKYNVLGNAMYTQVTKELDVPFKRKGTHLLYSSYGYLPLARMVIKRGKKNGVPGVGLVSGKTLYEREPYLEKGYKFAVHMPSTGVLSPYTMTIAFAENAVKNGAVVSLNTMVESMALDKSKIATLKTNRGDIRAKVVINAAGVHSDRIAEMAGDGFFTIHPRKGEILLLDKKQGHKLQGVMADFSLKQLSSKTKGGGLVKTVEDNIIVGPDAYEQPLREDYSTHKSNVDALMARQLHHLQGVNPSHVITYLAGTRASTFKEDFIVEASEYVDNLIHAAGIQSPGLASAPAIAEAIEEITVKTLNKEMKVIPKADYDPYRKGITNMSMLKDEQRQALIAKNKDYGIILCRCEEISKGEIIEAINSPIKAQSLDAIKRRTRAGMGRCQGGFCGPLIAKVLAEQEDMDLLSVSKKGTNSPVLVEKVYKEDAHGTA